MLDQKNFLTQISGREISAAPQDVSRSILEELLAQGYMLTRWNTSPGATDGPCIAKNGDEMPLADFIIGLVHDAAIYEKTHVGCRCSVTVSGPDLPDVEVSAFGRVG